MKDTAAASARTQHIVQHLLATRRHRGSALEPAATAGSPPGFDIVIIGAGWSGILLAIQLLDMGIPRTAIRIFEKGGDVGGTWYWNRYPGCACDVESYCYLPLLQRMDYVPSRKFPGQAEIYGYAQSVAKRFGLYDLIEFHTTVERCVYSSDGKWTVHVNGGKKVVSTKFVVSAMGGLSAPRLPDIKGRDTFEGLETHTSDWDASIDLKGLRVGVIGTGASACQVVPEAAKVCKEVYVFQRTPSYCSPRNDEPTPAEWIHNFRNDNSFLRKIRDRNLSFTDGGFYEKLQSPVANEKLQKRFHGEIDAQVSDAATAEALKPRYPVGCKRLLVMDEFWPSFNQENVTLVDTKGQGVQRISKRGPVVEGVEYEVDLLVYATGFDATNGAFQAIEFIGKDGVSLSTKWKDGPRTYLGVHTKGFPNLCIMMGPQGWNPIANAMVVIETQALWISRLVGHMASSGIATVDVSERAEEEWVRHCNEVGPKTVWFACDNWYNKGGRDKHKVAQSGAGSINTYTDRMPFYQSKMFSGVPPGGVGNPLIEEGIRVTDHSYEPLEFAGKTATHAAGS